MTDREIEKAFIESQRMYDNAKRIAEIAIRMMQEANRQLKELADKMGKDSCR